MRLYPVSDRRRRLARQRRLPHGVQIGLQGLHGLVRVRQELQGLQEVRVMTATLVGFLRIRERLIGRCREQQHARVGLVEELVRQFGRFAAGLHVQQVPKALELVQDHEVRLERRNGGPREHPAQPANNLARR